MKILTGYLSPSSGSVRIAGVALALLDPVGQRPIGSATMKAIELVGDDLRDSWQDLYTLDDGQAMCRERNSGPSCCRQNR
jgi:hypothetical protein